MKAALVLDAVWPPSPDQVGAVQAALAECGLVAQTAVVAAFTPRAVYWVDGDCILNRLQKTAWVDMLVGITAGPMFYSGIGGRALGLASIGAPRMVIAAYAQSLVALRATVHHEFLHTLGYTHCPGYFGPCVMAPRLETLTLDLCVRCKLTY